MKMCPSCHLKVGGQADVCPICQNDLDGEENQELYWPMAGNLKAKSILYKIQLFVVLVAVVVCLGLDFMIDLHGKLHWSLLVALWGLGSEYTVARLFMKNVIIPKVITIGLVTYTILLLITSWYVGIIDYTVEIIIPIIVLAALVANFVLALVDKSENALVYLICSILAGLVPYLGLLIKRRGHAPVLWSVCIMVSLVTVIGIAVFKGGKMLTELRKRTNI